MGPVTSLSAWLTAAYDWLPLLAATTKKDEPSPWAFLTIPLITLIVVGFPLWVYRRLQRFREERLNQLDGQAGFSLVDDPPEAMREALAAEVGTAAAGLFRVRFHGDYLERQTELGRTVIGHLEYLGLRSRTAQSVSQEDNTDYKPLELDIAAVRPSPFTPDDGANHPEGTLEAELVDHRGIPKHYARVGLSGSAVLLLLPEDMVLPRFRCRLRMSKLGDIRRIRGLGIASHPTFSLWYAVETRYTREAKILLTREACEIILREPRLDLHVTDGLLLCRRADTLLSPAAMLDYARRLDALATIFRAQLPAARQPVVTPQ